MSEMRPDVETSLPVHAHETRDADVHKLMIFGIALLGLIVFGYVVTEISFHYLVGRRKITPPTTFFSKSQMPPPPLEQQHVGTELQRYLEEENSVLNGYGWVDRKAGIVRIPIDQAMDSILQKGFPVRQPGQMTLAPSQPYTGPRGDFGPGPVGVEGPQRQ